LRSLVDGLDAIIWEADAPSLRFRFVSGRAERILGYPVSQWLAEPDFWATMLHPDDGERTVERLRRAALDGADYDAEHRAVAADGRVVWFRNIVHVVRAPSGDVSRLRGVMVDVTHRAKAARFQAAQHALTHVLAETTNLDDAVSKVLQAVCETLGWEIGLIWMVDAEGGTLRCLQSWARPGGEAPEFVSMSLKTAFPRGVGLPGRVWSLRRSAWISDVVDDTNFPRMPVAVKEGLRAGFGFPIFDRGDVLGVLEFFAREVREPDDDVLAMMGSIGGQVGYLISRRRADQAARESDALAKAMLSAALDCVITVNADGVIVEFNPAAERTFGYSRSEAVGRRVDELIIPPSLRERHLLGLARYRASGEAPILGKRMELTGMRADGSEFPVELTVVKVDLPAQPMFTGYLRDITEGKRTELALRESRERSEFLAEASALLARSLDYEGTLAALVRLAVPSLADWCFADVIDSDGSLRRVAVAHADPDHAELAEQLSTPHPAGLDPGASGGAPEVLRTGKPEIMSDPVSERGDADPADPEHVRVLTLLGARSSMCVPLVARGRTLGAITFVASDSGRAYGASDLALAEELARRAAVAVDNARLYHERTRVARTLQQSLLPPSLPDIPGVEIAARYRPAGEEVEVGGDFYDVFRCSGRGWAVVIGDVCGKGTQAAALTSVARHTIRAAAMQARKPKRILSILNEALLRHRPEETHVERFCTVSYLRLDPTEQGARITAACGGHPSPLILRSGGEVEVGGAPGTLLGVFPDPHLSDTMTDLAPGDVVLLYTDGVTETRGPGGPFGEERLRWILADSAGCGAGEIAERLERGLTDFLSGELPRDDLAFLVLRVLSPGPGKTSKASPER
jgi:PAS domain S-box-containing protein